MFLNSHEQGFPIIGFYDNIFARTPIIEGENTLGLATSNEPNILQRGEITMKRKSIPVLVIMAFAPFISSCGGGGDDKDPNVGVLNYGSCGNTPNYVANINTLRWKRFPVTISIDLSAAPRFSEGSNSSIYLRAVQAAVSAWAVGNGIGVVNIVGTNDADIKLSFVTSLPNTTLGLTTLNRDGAYIAKGTLIGMSVNAFTNLATTTLLESSFRQAVIHEMGHALFSQGHSPVSTDLMNGFSETLSQRDINTIREAYCRPL